MDINASIQMIYNLKDFCFTYSTYMQVVFHFVYNNLGFLFLFLPD
jgi:hypothetical protein